MKEDIQKNKNIDEMKLAVSQMQQIGEEIMLGGGKEKLEKLKKKNKLSARERVAFLIDEDAPCIELGLFAGYEMYEKEGGCQSGGTVGVMSYVSGKQCIVVANDMTVKAGAWFPITAKKNLRLQEIAMENRLPIIYLVDSAGVYLPMQDEIFPDKEDFGRVFRNNAKMSAMGIVQIAAVMGSCVAGGAYLPIMSDETLMVSGNGSIFLAGPYLVKAAIGEDIDAETLGGAVTHTEISGIADYKFESDEECLDQIKSLMDKIPESDKAGFDRAQPKSPKLPTEEVYSIVSKSNSKPYETRDLIATMIDEDSFDEYKKDYGKTIVCGYARIDGWSVGIVANQREVVKSGKKEMQIGGVIYHDSADKAARFILNCNQRKIPLVFLQDVTGFMVGSQSEHAGIIKDGAKLVNAVSNSIVPKITIIVGNSFGAGNYAMCGKAYDPRFIYAWPNAKIAVMGGAQAAKVLMQIEKASAKKKGEEISPEKEAEMNEVVINRYEKQTSSYYAAARLWVDAIIDPKETRDYISESISAANHAPIHSDLKLGVFQV